MGRDRQPRKRYRPSIELEDDSDLDLATSISSESEEDKQEEHKTNHLPLTKEQISTKTLEIRSMKKSAQLSRVDIEDRMQIIRQEQEMAIMMQKDIEMEIHVKCILERNRYSKAVIQQQYAGGMKGLDYELAAEQNENFNLGKDTRDYEEIATNLLVFCVYARGYQSLNDRIPKDRLVSSYRSIEETEIPMLQRHCITMTKPHR